MDYKKLKRYLNNCSSEAKAQVEHYFKHGSQEDALFIKQQIEEWHKQYNGVY